MTYHVTVLPAAHEDAAIITAWLAHRSPAGAIRWLQAFHDAVDSLESAAESNALAVEHRRLRRPLRQALFRTPHGRYYRLVYVVEEQEVRVLRVRAPGQRP